MSLLREARHRARMSQEQVAARLRQLGYHVERTAISYWERTGSVPEDMRPVLARILRAPELLPGRGRVYDEPPLVALAWAREEISEAAAVIDRICTMLRRGEDPRTLELHLWDLYTTLDTYFAARARYDGVDLGWYEAQHEAKLDQRYGRRQPSEMAVA